LSETWQENPGRNLLGLLFKIARALAIFKNTCLTVVEQPFFGWEALSVLEGFWQIGGNLLASRVCTIVI